MKNVVRQGDVTLVSTELVPSQEAKQVHDNGRVILAYGEVTGHCHEVVCTTAGLDMVPPMQLFEEPNGMRLLVLNKPSRLVHDEHGPIELPFGNYRVIRQREYTPEAIREVAD